ncbi:hypothetical protein TRIATDRAFT_88843 [Trichoderma atroviride IMI 206040]|uniref:Uncharacterized protein n=1 Tax=Hypocrea atroviridis (strain ATCC 20476 / IMI 206040) TaxID=452589 RepID=G9NUN2_HYPAI|nr:uncharacterized protein TRIATDRAFT_88843 [Trichoderma atroviride IMI 206040]EHK45757.1 hypothetical protein TRIATDRAFT_88843 [Trichoderma atroviride IMI 206040]
MAIVMAGDKRRIRYERASGVGDVLYRHVSGEWNDARTVTTRINQSDSPAKAGGRKAAEINGKHIDPSGWAGRQIGRLVADFCASGGDHAEAGKLARSSVTGKVTNKAACRSIHGHSSGMQTCNQWNLLVTGGGGWPLLGRRLMLGQGFVCRLHKHGRKLTRDRFMADSSSKVELPSIRSAAGIWSPTLLTTAQGDLERLRFDEETGSQTFQRPQCWKLGPLSAARKSRPRSPSKGSGATTITNSPPPTSKSLLPIR